MTNAREARLILPRIVAGMNIHKVADIHQSLRRELCRTFGGYTVFAADGGWIDEDSNGRLEHDEHWAYDIAMPDETSKGAALGVLAIKYGRLLEQQAVYVRKADGRVSILSTAGAGAADKPMTRDATDKAERILGTKRLPKVGEVWATRSGGYVAVVEATSSMVAADDLFCVLIERGRMGVAVGYTYTVTCDGLYSRVVDEHPFDLMKHACSYR